MSIFISFVGIVVLLGAAVLISDNRKAINLRTVGGAFAIQFGLGAFILYVPVGRDVLFGVSQGVSSVISYGSKGIEFLFGSLVNYSVEGVGFIFAFQVLPIIIFFSALVSVLYYLGIMQWVIKILGGGLQKALGTSKAESLSAAGNIFVGQTEAPLIIAPYVPKMTNSELFAVMCGGLASVAGSVLAGYAALGVPMEYLIAASFMAAPGGLLFAKIIKPEVETYDENVLQSNDAEEDGEELEEPVNVIDAAARGIGSGLQLAAIIGAMLIGFISLIALLNGLLGGVGGLFGMPELTLELILGYVFAPLAFLIGIPWEESMVAGSFIGQKLIVNEFVAYLNFAPYLSDTAEIILSEKSKAIISFALCGFANLASIAVLLGGLGTMAPKRRGFVASMGLKAVAAGSLSNLMSATIAGLFLSF